MAFAADTLAILIAVKSEGEQTFGRLTEGFEGLKLAALAAGAIIAGTAVKMGVDAVESAADFEFQMVKLVGTAGESQKAIGAVGEGILQMAGQVGYGAHELADAMYLVESANFHGAQGLDVLRASAMAAKAENADLTVVANAVTSALNAYAMSGTQASHVTDILLQATAEGKMTFQDLAGSLSHVLPIAATAHIGLQEVAAALATMTAQGVPADVAATDLQYAIKGLEVPSKVAQTEFKTLGLNIHQFADELQSKGLVKTLDDLTETIGKKFPAGSAEYNQALSKIVGNVEGLNAILMVSGTHADTFKSNLAGVGDSAGKTSAAFDEASRTVSGRVDQIRASLGAWQIEMGQKLLPAAQIVLNWIADVGFPAVKQASEAVVAWFTANWPKIAAIAKQVWDDIMQGWNQVAPILKAEWPAAISAVTQLFGYLQQHSDLVRDALYAVGAAAAIVVGALIGLGVAIVGALAALQWLYDRFQDVNGAINDAITSVDNFINALSRIPVIGSLVPGGGHLQLGGSQAPAAGTPGGSAGGGGAGGGGLYGLAGASVTFNIQGGDPEAIAAAVDARLAYLFSST